jgi:hypothetical protein
MITNSAFLAAMVVMLLAFLVAGELSFLAPYKYVLLREHLAVIVGGIVVAFVNLFAGFYVAARTLFLKDTGRKLAHLEKQLRTGDTIVRDLSERLAQEE